MDGGKLGQGDLEENVAYERWKEALVGRLAKRRPPYSEDEDTDGIMIIAHVTIMTVSG